jgi:serine/threonine-protein kinase
MGDVFLAFDSRLRRHVAIKRIRSGQPRTARARERLRREAAAAAGLNHPAIVRVYDILDEPDGQAIILEYVEGHTLARILAAGSLPAAKAIGLVRQIAEGLAAAHEVGLVHRDLKIQNVLVTPAGQARILDFGLAKRLSSEEEEEDGLTGEGGVVGTARVMSPEQAEGRPLDARSDLFSLGVLLYEVCAGRSPFEGDTRLTTLRKVVSEPPPPLAELNPDLPEPLVRLVDELLQKDPASRPTTAQAVAGRLGWIQQLPGLDSLMLPPPPAPGSASAANDASPKETRTARVRASRRFVTSRSWLALLVGLSVLGAILTTQTRREAVPARPLAVLVHEPTTLESDPDDRARFTAFAVREAALEALLDLRDVEAIGPDELAQTGVPAQDAARATAADEVLAGTMTCEGQWCRVSLRRQRATDGRVVGAFGPFEVSSAPEDVLDLASAVAFRVRASYREHPSRSNEARLDVRGEDYEQYLRLRRRMDRGDMLDPKEIDALERITSSSPGLTEAAVLAADAARLASDQHRAERILEGARGLHPGDIRLTYALVQLRIEAGEVAAAEGLLDEMERRSPGDVRVWRARARLLSRQGKLQEAADVRRRVVRERASWKNLWYLADVEIEIGNADAARLRLRQLLELSPGNAQGLEKLAEVEWELGDPAAAAEIYRGLLTRKLDRMYLSNLCWSLLLAGDFRGAVDSCERALQLEGDHALTRLNLGIAHEGGGDEGVARKLYRDLVERLAAREQASGLKGPEQFVKAQALARLGDCVPAVDLTTRALAASEPSGQTAFRAAIVYALCDERNHAIVYAREAAKRGLSRSWFRIPGFEALRTAPEFSELLAPPRATPSAGPAPAAR